MTITQNTSTSKLINDINDILITNKNHKPSLDIEVKLHTEEKDLTIENGVYLYSIYNHRDYENNITDYIEITLQISLGTYIYDIYPNLSNIELSILYLDQEYENEKPKSLINKYKAVFLKDMNKHIPTEINISRSDLDQQAPVVIKLQLLDRTAEVLKLKFIQGNFDSVINKNKANIKKFLESIVTTQAKTILIENKPCIESVNVEEPDNKEPLPSITIPSGTRLIDIADFYQNTSNGIYSAGVGSYIQKFNEKQTYFIYSLYNSKKYNKQDYKTIFYIPMDSSFSHIDKTYSYKDNILKIITEPNKSIINSHETDIMSSGSGFRLSNAKSFMKKPVIITEEGPKFSKQELNTEIVYKERKDGINLAPVSSNKISGNIFNKVSDIIKNSGSYINLKWYNSNIKYIYPGQACKITYEDKNSKVIEKFGVILKIETIIQNESNTETLRYLGKSTFSIISIITIFLN